MSVRRKYSLPGCTLILEGVTTEASGRRPTISAVVNAECHILGQSQILAGGQGFLQQLTETLSTYTQSLLSGIEPIVPEGHIAIEPVPPLEHRLTITDPGLETPVSLDLSTLQLFDLLESLDQMLADARTLPSWSLDLKPLTRHQARLDPPIAERATPAAIGVSSLAVAALALFFLPVPDVRRPTEPEPVSAEEQVTTNGDSSTGSTPPTDDDLGETPGGSATEADESNSTLTASDTDTDPSVEADDVAGAEATVDMDATDEMAETAENSDDNEDDLAEVDSDLDSDRSESSDSPELDSEPGSELDADSELEMITDSDQLYALNLKLDQDLSTAWDSDAAPNDDQEYRVSVGRDGAIIGYIGRSPGSESYVDSTPLPDQLYVPTQAGRAQVEEQAEFRVVFSESGTIEVSPWDGYADDPGDPPSLTDAATVEPRWDELSDTLRDNLSEEPSFDRDLAYRLGVTEDGTLAYVESLTGDARSLYGETPLPDLYDPAAALSLEDDRVTLAPLVEFRVVFKPNGVIEMAPWYGMN